MITDPGLRIILDPIVAGMVRVCGQCGGCTGFMRKRWSDSYRGMRIEIGWVCSWCQPFP